MRTEESLGGEEEEEEGWVTRAAWTVRWSPMTAETGRQL